MTREHLMALHMQSPLHKDLLMQKPLLTEHSSTGLDPHIRRAMHDFQGLVTNEADAAAPDLSR